MILASIFIGPDGPGQAIELPPVIAENIASLKRHHPALPHRLFSGEDIEAFLEAKFPREVQAAYRSLKPFAYKADLARYCILYELGGVYADLAWYFGRPMPFDGSRPVLFRDLLFSSPWDTNNAVFAAPARHAALNRAIDLVCANVKERYYGSTYLCPTGPALFGRAFAIACRPEEMIVGASGGIKGPLLRAELPGVTLPSRAHCLTIEQRIIAAKRKPLGTGGLAALGAKENDNYRVRWKQRDIYA